MIRMAVPIRALMIIRNQATGTSQFRKLTVRNKTAIAIPAEIIIQTI